jgi:hypothetical protein
MVAPDGVSALFGAFTRSYVHDRRSQMTNDPGFDVRIQVQARELVSQEAQRRYYRGQTVRPAVRVRIERALRAMDRADLIRMAPSPVNTPEASH